MYSSTLSHLIVEHQINERLEEARRERLARSVDRNSFVKNLANKVIARLTSRNDAAEADEAISQELPGTPARADIS